MHVVINCAIPRLLTAITCFHIAFNKCDVVVAKLLSCGQSLNSALAAGNPKEPSSQYIYYESIGYHKTRARAASCDFHWSSFTACLAPRLNKQTRDFCGARVPGKVSTVRYEGYLVERRQHLLLLATTTKEHQETLRDKTRPAKESRAPKSLMMDRKHTRDIAFAL